MSVWRPKCEKKRFFTSVWKSNWEKFLVSKRLIFKKFSTLQSGLVSPKDLCLERPVDAYIVFL